MYMPNIKTIKDIKELYVIHAAIVWMGGRRGTWKRTTEKRSEETKRRKVVINFRFVFCYIYIILMLSITWKKITSCIESHCSHTHSIPFQLMTSHAQEMPLRTSILRNSKGEKRIFFHLHSVSAFVNVSL